VALVHLPIAEIEISLQQGVEAGENCEFHPEELTGHPPEEIAPRIKLTT
jgi:hypothetical protein